MPIYHNARILILSNLQTIGAGDRAAIVPIGQFTIQQFTDLNLARADLGLHALESNEILFMGRHLYNSRSKDGYTTADMVEQICSALHESSVIVASVHMSCMRSMIGRADGYGNTVFDQAVFELTARKPKAELFSVIPKGDTVKPQN
ncbi:hypothetical protein FHX10_003218 [Rhizobium sp. BK591]|uniref:hypothetical protein n=1 Tax=Rhizobium sp. BK591 TaxID=2586985 RepID=UPI001622A777|nr:hypothetical protein [Rhizobium sp. BK591]MBB3743719.1 hypothetical protein [Rhizobium sp. BK591]